MVNDPPNHNHNHNHHHHDGWGRAALGDSSVKEEKWRRPTHDDKLATPNHVYHRALTHENKLKQNWNYSQENRRVTDTEYATSWQSGVSGNSRSRPFPRMKASDSLSWIMGMDFFHSLPVPEFWECFFFIPSPFPNYGNQFFHSLPIPKFAISQKGIKTGIGLL